MEDFYLDPWSTAQQIPWLPQWSYHEVNLRNLSFLLIPCFGPDLDIHNEYEGIYSYEELDIECTAKQVGLSYEYRTAAGHYESSLLNGGLECNDYWEVNFLINKKKYCIPGKFVFHLSDGVRIKRHFDLWPNKQWQDGQ